MMRITLNRDQIEKLSEIANHFKEIEHFTLEAESSSGIGQAIHVKFDLFDTGDTKVDITDVESW